MVADSGWMADRRRVGARIRPNDRDPCRAAALPEGLGGRRSLEVVAGLAFHQPDAAIPREAVAVGLLDLADDVHWTAPVYEMPPRSWPPAA